MVNTLLFDFARVIIFHRNREYKGELNYLHRSLMADENYRFNEVFELDEALLAYIKELKAKYEIFMFTSGTLQEVPEAAEKLKGIFKEIFSAGKLGVNKTEASSYIKVAELMGKKPDEVLFIDDSEKNVEAAKMAGMKEILYKNLEQLKNELVNVV